LVAGRGRGNQKRELTEELGKGSENGKKLERRYGKCEREVGKGNGKGSWTGEVVGEVGRRRLM
jgi:hypothetical protein